MAFSKVEFRMKAAVSKVELRGKLMIYYWYFVEAMNGYDKMVIF